MDASTNTLACDTDLRSLGCWVKSQHTSGEIHVMVRDNAARQKAAHDLYGRFFTSSPEFARLVNKLVDPRASKEIHLSAIREALHKIQLGECDRGFNAEIATAAQQESEVAA